MMRDQAYQILARVRDELETARFALSVVAQNWDRLTTSASPITARAIAIGNLRLCRDHIELTYIMRLFAAFEATLRDYWLNGVGRKTEPDLISLLTSLTGRQNMDAETLAAVNNIREWRNQVIHRDMRLQQFDFPSCARAFGLFISWLPIEW